MNVMCRYGYIGMYLIETEKLYRKIVTLTTHFLTQIKIIYNSITKVFVDFIETRYILLWKGCSGNDFILKTIELIFYHSVYFLYKII